MSLKAGAKRSARQGLLSWVLVLRVWNITSRRGGGNVGIAQRFPRAVGNEGKPGFGFPRFPDARHFHGPPRFHFYALLLCCKRANNLRFASRISMAAWVSDFAPAVCCN